MNEIFGGFPFEEKCTKLGGFNSGSLVFSYILVCQKIECPFFVLSAQFDRDWGPAEPQMIKKPNLHNSWSFSFFQKNLLTKLANLAKNGFWKFEKPPNRQNGGFWAVFVRFLGVFCGFSFYLLYIDESHIARSQSRVLLLKNDKNRTKTAQNTHKNRTKMPYWRFQMPYWRFRAVPDFKNSIICTKQPFGV